MYAPSHCYKGRLFRMDMEQGCLIEMCKEPPDNSGKDDTMAIEEGTTKISLHALSDTFNQRIIRLWGSIKGRELSLWIVDQPKTSSKFQLHTSWGWDYKPFQNLRCLLVVASTCVSRGVLTGSASNLGGNTKERFVCTGDGGCKYCLEHIVVGEIGACHLWRQNVDYEFWLSR